MKRQRNCHAKCQHEHCSRFNQRKFRNHGKYKNYTKIKVALLGNPNSGKTTIFNQLTGLKGKVGNYPGVTVEGSVGYFTIDKYIVEVVDLPGTYSLNSNNIEEKVVENFILNEKPDILINIIDSTNLERNLYMTTQLLELDIPIIPVLNMIDEAKDKGININYRMLNRLFDLKFVPCIGNKAFGIDEITIQIIKLKEKIKHSKVKLKYDKIENYISKINNELLNLNNGNKLTHLPDRWIAIKLLEESHYVKNEVKNNDDIYNKIQEIIDKANNEILSIYKADSIDEILAQKRYEYLRSISNEIITKKKIGYKNITDNIDNVLTHRIFGFPIFLLLMYLVFQLTFTIGEYPVLWIESFFNFLSSFVENNLSDSFIKDFLLEAAIGGVGGVIVFLPNILLLFLALTFLESTGYMARAAFIVDKLMNKIGLQGKSFIPMLIGFGCGIPAIMATRTLNNDRDRIATMLIVPLMSCGAKLPLYGLLIPAFFSPSISANVLFSIYLIGIILAVITIKILKSTILKGENAPFVLELPPYRIPTFRSIASMVWIKTAMFLKKAGTIILLFSAIIWIMSNIYIGEDGNITTDKEKIEYSITGYIGKGVSYTLEPIGLGDWKIGTALFTGFAAKEIVVSTLGTLYAVDEESEDNTKLRDKIKADSFFTPLKAYTFMIFMLLYVPCIGTIAAIKKESGGWKWPSITIIYTILLAWTVSFVIYNLGKLIGF